MAQSTIASTNYNRLIGKSVSFSQSSLLHPTPTRVELPLKVIASLLLVFYPFLLFYYPFDLIPIFSSLTDPHEP